MKKLFSMLMLVPLVGLATGCCCSSGNQCCPPAYSSGGCSSGTCGPSYGYPGASLPSTYSTTQAMTPASTYATAAAAPTYSSYPPATQTAMAPVQALPTY